MKNDTQLKVQAYLDNELSPGEARGVASLISSDSEAHALYSELKETKEVLIENEPVLPVRDSREFYWSGIQRRIESAERVPAASASSAAPFWMRILAPLAGAVALFALLISVVNPGQPVTATADNASIQQPLHEVEDLAPDVSTITFRSEAEGVTVVWVSSQ